MLRYAALLWRHVHKLSPVDGNLARVHIDQLRKLREAVPERLAHCPVTKLAHVLFVDGVDGDLGSAVAVDGRGEQHGCRVVRPVQLEAGAVQGGEVVQGDLGVGNEILASPWPGPC